MDSPARSEPAPGSLLEHADILDFPGGRALKGINGFGHAELSTGRLEHAIEVSYEGSYELDEQSLADGSILDDHFSAMGGWISATLVRLGDLSMAHLPPMIDD